MSRVSTHRITNVMVFIRNKGKYMMSGTRLSKFVQGKKKMQIVDR